jgi:hypothetical protein
VSEASVGSGRFVHSSWMLDDESGLPLVLVQPLVEHRAAESRETGCRKTALARGRLGFHLPDGSLLVRTSTMSTGRRC